MVEIFQRSNAWTYLKQSKKHHDGRMGYKLIYNHFLVPSNIDHISDGANKKLYQCTYTREKRNLTFEKYTTFHKQQNNILEILKEHGYTGIYQQSKVRYLSKGIKTTGLDSVNTRIMSDKSLYQDFDGYLTL